MLTDVLGNLSAAAAVAAFTVESIGLIEKTKALAARLRGRPAGMGTSVRFVSATGPTSSTPLVPAFVSGCSESWMSGAPQVSAERRELAAAIREQLASDEDVIRLGPTDAERAADALDGF